jgi:pyridoxamine 5'-phosphate oxidase
VDIGGLRSEYTRSALTEAGAGSDPLALFTTWLAEALASEEVEPNAMTLATATPGGVPSARMVLLKGADERGFTFFTNYGSRKGRELAANPVAALVVYWASLSRQVRVEGRVGRVTPAESAAYFATRPRGSRLGALASEQSAVIAGREVLERRLAELEAAHPGDDVPMPANWGGYRLVPDVIEFWQGRPNRLHDRLSFRRAGADWTRKRLAP